MKLIHTQNTLSIYFSRQFHISDFVLLLWRISKWSVIVRPENTVTSDNTKQVSEGETRELPTSGDWAEWRFTGRSRSRDRITVKARSVKYCSILYEHEQGAGQGAGRVCHMIVSQEILILPNLLIVSTIVSWSSVMDHHNYRQGRCVLMAHWPVWVPSEIWA